MAFNDPVHRNKLNITYLLKKSLMISQGHLEYNQ